MRVQIKGDLTEIKEEIVLEFHQAEERLRQQIAEGNEQIIATMQELRSRCFRRFWRR